MQTLLGWGSDGPAVPASLLSRGQSGPGQSLPTYLRRLCLPPWPQTHLLSGEVWPPNSFVGVLSPVPRDITLFGSRVLAGDWVSMSSLGRILTPRDHTLIKGKFGHRHMQGDAT